VGGTLSEPLDVCIRCSSEKEEFIKVALPNELGLAAGKACVLDKFAWSQSAERDNRNAGFPCNLFECLSRDR
jgi:hypothetical protein